MAERAKVVGRGLRNPGQQVLMTLHPIEPAAAQTHFATLSPQLFAPARRAFRVMFVQGDAT